MTPLLVTTNDILNLIERAENTDIEKERFRQIALTSPVVEGVSNLQLVFENGENIYLKGITMQNLFLNDLNK